MKTFLLPLLVLPLCGCMNLAVPKTTISGTIAGQKFSISSPKDSEMIGLTVTADPSGAVAVEIKSLKANMNPSVITMTGQAEAQVISAVAAGVANAMGSAAGAAAASAIGK